MQMPNQMLPGSMGGMPMDVDAPMDTGTDPMMDPMLDPALSPDIPLPEDLEMPENPAIDSSATYGLPQDMSEPQPLYGGGLGMEAALGGQALPNPEDVGPRSSQEVLGGQGSALQAELRDVLTRKMQERAARSQVFQMKAAEMAKGM